MVIVVVIMCDAMAMICDTAVFKINVVCNTYMYCDVIKCIDGLHNGLLLW